MSTSSNGSTTPVPWGRIGVVQRAGLAGALVGAAVVGAAAGVVADRYAARRTRRSWRGRRDPFADEPFGELPADTTLTVMTDDDVPLHVEVLEPPGEAQLTMVFVHGFCLDMGTWHFQRKALIAPAAGPPEAPAKAPSKAASKTASQAVAKAASKAVRRTTARLAPRVRMVFYDQPGHGRSGRRESGEYTLDQLGSDLAKVIAEVAPTGPLVLAGHSMGGMTIMALAEQQPDLIIERVVGLALFSTSAGHLDDVALGLPPVVARFRGSLMPRVAWAIKMQPTLAEYSRRAGGDLAYLLTKRYGFGTDDPSPALVRYAERMNASTAIDVIAGYLRTLSDHDRYAALEAFADAETLVVCGDRDMVTPVEHTREIARLLPQAELVEIPSGGHLTVMEHADTVNEALERLLQRAARGTAQDGRRITRVSRAVDAAARAARRAKAEQGGSAERLALRRILRRKDG